MAPMMATKFQIAYIWEQTTWKQISNCFYTSLMTEIVKVKEKIRHLIYAKLNIAAKMAAKMASSNEILVPKNANNTLQKANYNYVVYG